MRALLALLLLPATALAEIVPLPEGAVAYRPDAAAPDAPLVVLLHGAGEPAAAMLDRFRELADRRGFVLLAPQSGGPTWDIRAQADREGMIGAARAGEPLRYVGSADGDRVDAAVASLRARMPGGAAVLAGFSDGASFALAHGTDRRRDYTAVIAFSPGIATVAARPTRGRPVIVAHGRQDRTLPFATTRGTIVPALRRAGLAVTFQPFDGGHAATAAVIDAAFDSLVLAP